MNSLRIIFFLLLLSTFPSTLFASAWTKNERELFISTSLFYQRADKYFDIHGDKQPLHCTFEKKEFQIYGEYGLSNKTTLTFKFPYSHLNCDQSRTSGVADIELGLIRNIINRDGRKVLSYYVNTIIPTGYSIHRDPRLGYGRLGLESGLLFGASGKWGFFDSGVGYRFYSGYPSDQIRAYMTTGINLRENIQMLVTIDAHYGLSGYRRKNIGHNIYLEPSYKLLQINLGPRINFGSLSIVPTYQRVILGKNTGHASGFAFSLWYTF